MIKLVKSTFYKEKETKKKLGRFINNSQTLSFGKECEKFERDFAKWQGRGNCIFVNSGSSANLALIQSLLNLGKIRAGDKVGFSAITWSTNVMPLIELGLIPIPVDIELDTLNVSSTLFLRVLEKHNIKLLFITNLLGFCGDLDKIQKICRDKKIILIEDNCESLGTVYKGKKLGNYSLASTFSFYVGHHLSTIEGGAVCTDSQELANMLKIVRAHGWDRNLTRVEQDRIRSRNKINSAFYLRYTFYDLGYNLRPTEINGFIGNQQLKFIDEIVKKRNMNFLKLAPKIYRDEARFCEIKYGHLDLLSNFAVPLICKTKEIRDGLVEKCKGKLEIRPVTGGDITLQPFFTKHFSPQFDTPNAAFIHERGFYFGNNPELTKSDLREILNIFRL